MFKSIKNKIKNSGVLGNKTYGKTWQEREGKDQVDWYTIMHNSHEIQHQDFFETIQPSQLILNTNQLPLMLNYSV